MGETVCGNLKNTVLIKLNIFLNFKLWSPFLNSYDQLKNHFIENFLETLCSPLLYKPYPHYDSKSHHPLLGLC